MPNLIPISRATLHGGGLVLVQPIIRRCNCGAAERDLELADVYLRPAGSTASFRVGWELCLACATALAEAIRSGRFQPPPLPAPPAPPPASAP